MASLSPLQASVTNAAAASAQQAGSKSSLGKDDFLKLLMAQVANQDPLSPMDNQAFVAQLAQFANVEQLQGANQRLDTLALAQAGANQTASANLVGKDVTYRSSTLQLAAGAGAPIRGNLAADASSVTAVITDASGHTVKTLRLGAGAAGAFQATWDGRDDNQVQLPAGAYTLRLTAADAKGNAIATTTQASGRVSGVSFASGAAQLLVNGAQVSMGDVIEIDQPAN